MEFLVSFLTQVDLNQSLLGKYFVAIFSKKIQFDAKVGSEILIRLLRSVNIALKAKTFRSIGIYLKFLINFVTQVCDLISVGQTVYRQIFRKIVNCD